jgi:hypothetical protein
MFIVEAVFIGQWGNLINIIRANGVTVAIILQLRQSLPSVIFPLAAFMIAS